MTTLESRTITVRIDRDRDAVYAFASRPETFALWASGLGAGLRREGDAWAAEGPEGPITIRFSEPNGFGVLDHVVTTPAGTEVRVPLRVVANGTGAEVALTLFRQPGMSDAVFARDADWVVQDLGALKALLEAPGGASTAPASYRDSRIDYVELAVADLARSKAFYGAAFGWTFTDYGPTYVEFADGRLKGGFTTEGMPAPGGPLVILYADDLEDALARVQAAGGRIVRPIFGFPGGRRFHFADPDGYELAVWSRG
ncbi:VOC family protein [Arenibaculum sp.]|uniref:VOC family protein n=1 Tax=Arenibaculum sp. TaxID=2865862 RepID=UPI002E11038E|nr:VOC family protein [Arenibaculum sp.]